MENGKKLLIIAAAIALVISGGMTFVFGSDSVDEGSIRALIANEVENLKDLVGALTGPDISSPYLNWGGVKTYQARQSLSTATSTPCNIQSPAATSTLIYTALRVTTSTSTATTWTIAKAASSNATTTVIGRDAISLGSGALGTMFFVGSSTGLSIDSAETFAPSQYLVWGAKGFLPADTTKLNGFCEAVFRTI